MVFEARCGPRAELLRSESIRRSKELARAPATDVQREIFAAPRSVRHSIARSEAFWGVGGCKGNSSSAQSTLTASVATFGVKASSGERRAKLAVRPASIW